MAHTKTSRAWLHEHVNDHYVHLAKAGGWRSRAVFKLMEIDERDHLLREGECVIDLGAAPGSWSQFASKRVGRQGKVIALDMLDMTPLHGVEFIQGDFREDVVLQAVANSLKGQHPGLVLSDMSPNLSGVSVVDQGKAMHLAELALAFAQEHLRREGALLVKVFQGAGFPDFLQAMREVFVTVHTRKPKASRDRSAEIYLLGKALR